MPLEPKKQDRLLDLAVAVAKALEPEEKEAAKERKAHEGRPGKLPERMAGRTRDKLAAIAGVSGSVLERAIEVVEAAEKAPEKFGPLVEEMDRTGRVSGVYRKLKVQRQIEAIKKEPMPAPVSYRS